MAFSTITGAVELGLILAVMSLGMFISYKILNIPDLTVDGSFTLGTVVSTICAANGMPVVGILLAVLAGALAGMATGFLQTKLKVQPILAGILTMTALYSLNLRVMVGKPNIPLISKGTVFTPLEALLPELLAKLVPLLVIVLVVFLLLHLFLKTQLGMCLRATGDNEDMVRASSINSEGMKILGLAVANMAVALGGALMAQYQKFGDVSSGIGMMVIGLASIIVGDAFCGKGSVLRGMLAAVLGAIAYRFLLTLALQFQIVDSNDLKLFSALLVVIAISVPVVKNAVLKRRARYSEQRGERHA